ncbi:hypothetical protein [Sphingomonas parapaucimobilis]|uniref:hypothetical protein n=1 Tax=Sphingomonas parapaucimobilis TaxID=28213 RepID=UPI00321AC54E
MCWLLSSLFRPAAVDPLAPLRADLDAALTDRRMQRPTSPRLETRRFELARPKVEELRRSLAGQQVSHG